MQQFSVFKFGILIVLFFPIKMRNQQFCFVLTAHGNSNHIEIIFQGFGIMQNAINGIVFGIVTILTFVLLYGSLTFNYN